jgi:hypothetical protein
MVTADGGMSWSSSHRYVLAGVLLQGVIAETLLAVVGYTSHRPEQIAADLLMIAAFIVAALRLRRYPGRDVAR